MRINRIRLHNFGSYSEDNLFNFGVKSPEERVVVIGGKNGAGKTTLFTAIQVCLYGNYAFGYKTVGKRYLDDIYSLLNNQAKLDEAEISYVEIAFQQIDNTDLFDYVIRRSWTWPKNNVQESLLVWQNGKQLDEDELSNFQNYLLHLIPPDMLKLYFFDGEKIADYFLNSKEVNIRDALMILSGNDTFDILHDQIKRVFRNSESGKDESGQEYLDTQAAVKKLQSQVAELEAETQKYQDDISELDAEIQKQKKIYADRGGITIEEWTTLHTQLKSEEEKRERLNWQRKAIATDLLPFALLPQLIDQTLDQIQQEKDYQTYQTLKRSLQDGKFYDVLSAAVKSIGSADIDHDTQQLYSKISGYLLDSKWEQFELLLGLSSDDEGQLRAIVSRVSSFDKKALKNYKKRISASIESSKKIRARLQSTSIENFEEYMKLLADLEERLKVSSLKQAHAQELLTIKKGETEQQLIKLRALRKEFEAQLKRHSVSMVSGKALLLLEELQRTLYSDLIHQVEVDLNQKFREMIRKDNFFSKLYIDPQFVVHILRNQTINIEDLSALLRSGDFRALDMALGKEATKQLLKHYNAKTIADLEIAFDMGTTKQIELPIEINKDQLSSGEKQIFVMSLYWAMMKQSKNELPYIIDTPFARIDTEHRANITEYFFKNLSGQLIILSTNEELSSEHMQAMRSQISHVYMLDYGQDQKTHIYENQYFEE